MRVGGVVQDKVDDDLDPQVVGVLQQGAEVRDGADRRVDVREVCDVVAAVAQG